MITADIILAARLLADDQVVAVPTETVYGLAGNAFSEKAVERIFKVKDRPLSNPLIVHLKDVGSLEEVACQVPEIAYEFAKYFWPGPLTMVLKKKRVIPDIVTSGNDTVAVRVPSHPVMRQLLKTLPFPLAAPSANLFGCISPTTAQHVEDALGDRVGAVLDGGPCERGLESTIIGFEDGMPVIYRLGVITEAELSCVGSNIHTLTNDSRKPKAPGMFPRHYSPRTRTVLTADVIGMLHALKGKKVGVLRFMAGEQLYADQVEILSEAGDFQEAARNLYAAMHRLDACGLDLIVAELFPDTGLGCTINDRLRRAVAETDHAG